MDRPSETLPSFPRKVSGLGGRRGRFCSGGCLWGLPSQFHQGQKDLAVGLPRGDTNTLGVDNSPPAPHPLHQTGSQQASKHGWPALCSTQRQPGKDRTSPGTASSTRRHLADLEWAGQRVGGEGRAGPLTSWEISKCFLAKVRACAGLPMDT